MKLPILRRIRGAARPRRMKRFVLAAKNKANIATGLKEGEDPPGQDQRKSGEGGGTGGEKEGESKCI